MARTALWRALHVEFDVPPHVIEDTIGVLLAAPEDDWRSRPDMSPFTRPFRASIVARARFVEDLVAEEAARGVILGAGLAMSAERYFANRTDSLRPPNKSEELLVATT